MKSQNELIKALKYILIGIIVVCFVSCESDCYLQQLYVVENKTDNEFMVYFEYSIYADEVEVEKNSLLAPNESEHILYNEITYRYGGDTGTGDFNIWIYNRSDSLYFKINRDEVDGCFCDYAHVEVETSGSKIPLVKNEFKVIVNETLISKMTKNTSLTDSIFGLK